VPEPSNPPRYRSFDVFFLFVPLPLFFRRRSPFKSRTVPDAPIHPVGSPPACIRRNCSFREFFQTFFSLSPLSKVLFYVPSLRATTLRNNSVPRGPSVAFPDSPLVTTFFQGLTMYSSLFPVIIDRPTSLFSPGQR